LLQAYQTLRKGNKTFSVYDLTVTLEWTGCWKETDSKVLLCATCDLCTVKTCRTATSRPLRTLQVWCQDMTCITGCMLCEQVKGDIVITEFSSTNDPDEYEITINANDGDATAVQNLKAAISVLQPAIMERLAQYVADLNALAIQ
jgi:Activator of Hsp90 ATPase, N-terminal